MLREYQQKAFNQIKENFSKGITKQLLVMSCGAGKTVIFCELLKRCKEKNIKALMVVRGRQLVDQASNRLKREGIPHGVLMAGDYRYRLCEPIQVASVDTAVRRGIYPEAGVAIVDEAHMATSESYKEFISHYENILGVTATPYPEIGLGHIAETIVEPISFDELVEQGFLVPPRYFAPSLPDLKGVKTQGGEYNQEQLGKRMNDGALIGDLVSHFKAHASNRKAVYFAVNIKHSHAIADCFTDNGIPALHCDADTSLRDRNTAFGKLKDGIIQIIVNVGIVSTGVDIPWVDCIGMVRPTKSLNLYLQQLGRGTRPYEGKKDFLLLDHSGNCLRHGFINDKREPILTTSPSVTRTISPTQCLKCFAVFYGSKCPECSNINPAHQRKLEIKDGDLKEITVLTEDQKLIRYVSDLKKKIKTMRTKDGKPYKRGYAYFELKRTHGEEIANCFFKKRIVPSWVTRKEK